MIRSRWLSSAVVEPGLAWRRRVVGSVRSDIRSISGGVPPVYGRSAAEYQCLEDNARKSQAAGGSIAGRAQRVLSRLSCAAGTLGHDAGEPGPGACPVTPGAGQEESCRSEASSRVGSGPAAW